MLFKLATKSPRYVAIIILKLIFKYKVHVAKLFSVIFVNRITNFLNKVNLISLNFWNFYCNNVFNLNCDFKSKSHDQKPFKFKFIISNTTYF